MPLMEEEPSAKRLKGDSFNDAERCRAFIASFLLNSLPQRLAVTKIKNDTAKLQALFEGLGFRTSIVQSPRRALSVYLDSCGLGQEDEYQPTPKCYLTTLIGMNSRQDDLETVFAAEVRSFWCLQLFCKRIQEACVAAINKASEGRKLQDLLSVTIDKSIACIRRQIRTLPFDVAKRLSDIKKMVVSIDASVRPDQLDRELDRIQAFNITLTNAIAQRLFEFHEIMVKELVFKDSHLPQYKRLSFYLYDRDIDELKPSPFLFLPCLHRILRVGCQAVVTCMVEKFWVEMLKRGYFASEALRSAMEPNLTKYFQSGFSSDLKLPLILNAHFTPKFPLSFYFHGKAGAGKSSLVRSFGPSLNAVVEQYADPAILVRFVKQNLNKSEETLRLELDLRPNNNDLSVMSIIQSRRMTLGQSKPGLVVVGFEEMPSFGPNRDPEQLTLCQLISQRFAGRKGEYKEGVAPRNSAKRGISGDATIVPVFTSNYDLSKDSAKVLSNLEMFREMSVIIVNAISGKDRMNFAKQYVGHCLAEKGWTPEEISGIKVDIDVGEGDTRPLVRQLRMIAFYVNRMKTLQSNRPKAISVVQGETSEHYCIMAGESTAIEVHKSPDGNLYATSDTLKLVLDGYDPVTHVVSELGFDKAKTHEVSTVLTYWLEHTLAPAVVITQTEAHHKALLDSLAKYESEGSWQMISSVDASQYKMMKSLYDDSETKNLKDDIVALGGGKGAPFVVDLICPTQDSQLCIREMIEDTPSQTAFSSEKSALHKKGILFVVMIHGEVTPEVRSRASFVL